VIWDEIGSKMFKERLEMERIAKKGAEGEGEEMMLRIKRALEETEKEQRKEKRGKGGWWDVECAEKKKEVRRKLRR